MGLLDGLFGGGGNSGFDEAMDSVNRNRQLLKDIPIPKYQYMTPDLYDSEAAQYQITQEDPLLRSAQMSALAKMSGLAETGLSQADQADMSRARDQAAQMARGNTEAALQNAQARGVGGSGMEFAMREMASQGGAERARQQGMDVAANAAKQRAMYNQAYGQQLSGARADDARTNQANTNIINQFNQANTQARNQSQQSNANIKNQAFQYNQGLGDKTFQNQMQHAGAQMGLNNEQSRIGMAKDDAERKKRSGLGGLVGAGAGALMGGAAGAQVGSGIGSTLF